MYFYYYRLLVQVEQNKPMVVASLDANQWNKSFIEKCTFLNDKGSLGIRLLLLSFWHIWYLSVLPYSSESHNFITCLLKISHCSRLLKYKLSQYDTITSVGICQAQHNRLIIHFSVSYCSILNPQLFHCSQNWENKEHAKMCSEWRFSSTHDMERERKFPSLFPQSLPLLQNRGK